MHGAQMNWGNSDPSASPDRTQDRCCFEVQPGHESIESFGLDSQPWVRYEQIKPLLLPRALRGLGCKHEVFFITSIMAESGPPPPSKRTDMFASSYPQHVIHVRATKQNRWHVTTRSDLLCVQSRCPSSARPGEPERVEKQLRLTRLV